MSLIKGLPEGKYANLPNGQRIHYLDLGEPKNPAVVFLHGSGSGASGHSNFKSNYPFLEAKGYRVIVIDHVGYGYSSKPTDVNYHINFFVECLHQTLQSIGLKTYTLIGNSLGGAIALRYVLDFPKAVSSLVLMAPGGIENQPNYFTMPGMKIMMEVFTSGKPVTQEGMRDFFEKAFVVDKTCIDEQLVSERWHSMQTQNPHVVKTMVVPNMEDELHKIECPILAFWGMNEKMMPESGIMKLAKKCKDIQMILLSQAGHWIMLEHKDTFNSTTLNFLKTKSGKMNKEKIASLGTELYQALRSQKTLSPLTEREPNITIEDAYYISLHMLNLRLKNDGEKVVGKKIGVTSKPVQDMLGVFQPDFGFLTDVMEFKNNSKVSIKDLMIQPRAEAEIAFKLKKDLIGPGVTEADVLAATDYIMPCFEIVDSRIKDWKIKIQDTVADNASCGVYVLGDAKAKPQDHDLPNLKVVVKKNGEFLSEGLGKAVQGNPLTAVAWLANTLGAFGIPFKAGEVILSGSLVPLESVVAGDLMEMELEGIGSCSIQFV